MSQETRNKIYAVAGSIGAIAVALGLIGQSDADTALGLVDQGLTIAGSVLTLASTVIAFVKSLPSRVTTIDLPRHKVEAVLTTDSTTVAGPASPAADGTVLD